jgi:cleavage and polyadenylation specificity factor subunit 4
MAALASPSAAQLAEQLLNHRSEPYTFSFTPFLQRTYNHSLPADRPICKSYAATQHCANGTRCPERHVYTGPAGTSGKQWHDGAERGGFNSLVCKHWLRGLCKKGEACEFLHEYNLRRMPECSFFARNGYCSNGDECLYLHIDPGSKLPPCPHYERGFCPLGPRCAKKHARKPLCPLYLAGFCPDGRTCKEGVHPHWRSDQDLGEPTVRVEKAPEEIEAERLEKEEEAWEREKEYRERMDRDGEHRGYGRYDRKDKFEGGRGSRWRGGGRGGGGGGGGGQRFRGRNY